MRTLVLLLLAAVLCASCQVGPRCVKGESLECPCPGNELGAQTCDAHGEFGACACPAVVPCGPSGERRVPTTADEARGLLQRRWRVCQGMPRYFATAGIHFQEALWRGMAERDGQPVDDDSGEWMGPWSVDDLQADLGIGTFRVNIQAMDDLEEGLPQFFEGPPLRMKLDLASFSFEAGVAFPAWYTEMP